MSATNNASSRDAGVVEETAPEASAGRLERYFPSTSPLRQTLEQIFGPDLDGRDLSPLDIDHLIADIDRRICAQLDEILHAPEFQHIEARWRSLEYMKDRIAFNENTALEIFNVTKDELLEDFEDQLELTRSALYNVVYRREFGLSGGHPYGLTVLDYEFGPGRDDVELLGHCASIGSMAHCVVVGNASPSMLELDRFSDLPMMQQVPGVLRQPALARYNRLRESVDARYLGLCLPRFLVRSPYRQTSIDPAQIVYQERTCDGPEQYTWGHASAAFAVCVAKSFAKYRWCPNIIGPDSGGLVEGLVDLSYDAIDRAPRTPLECTIPPDLELDLSRVGLVSLTARRGSKDGVFLSASSVQLAMGAQSGDRDLDEKLGAQLPYLFIVTRIAHYLKVWQRQYIGGTRTAKEMERELGKWLRDNLVADMEDAGDRWRRRRPLRKARLSVEEVPGEIGWYRYTIEIQPHFRYMNADFRLSLVGRLERG